MSFLSSTYDGDHLLRVSGSFGKSKTVTINNFGGTTYIHLKSPKRNGQGWSNFTMNLIDYRELVRKAGPAVISQIAENFDIQNREIRERERAALEATGEASQPPRRRVREEEEKEEAAEDGQQPPRRRRREGSEEEEERRVIVINDN